jgi:hypothetical protein
MKCLFIVALMLTNAVYANELTIFDVRKNLAMSDTEKVYRDFYINGGSEAGLSTGMVITVERRLPLYDNYQNRSAGDLQLKVAKIKIIHVQKGIAVARLMSEFTRENAPLLEDNFIMVGDRLDMNSATSDKEGKKADSESSGQEPVARSSSPNAAHIVVNSVKVSDEPQTPVDSPLLQ